MEHRNFAPRRRGGRVVECGGLENRFTLTGNGGSNPSLSARSKAVPPSGPGGFSFVSWSGTAPGMRISPILRSNRSPLPSGVPVTGNGMILKVRGGNFVDMKPPKLTLTLLLILGTLMPALASVEVVVETRVFHVPGNGPRVEVNMAFIGGTFTIGLNERGFHGARIEALTIIEQNGEVKAFSKVEVMGQESLEPVNGDVLHQEFFSLPPGSYDLSIEVRDLLDADNTIARYQSPLAIGVLPAGVVISEIMMAERIERSEEPANSKFGYQVVPLISDYLPKEIGQMNFYAEVYGTDQVFGADSLFLLTYQLENFETKKVHGSYKKNVRAKGKPVEPVMAGFDIAKLPSGNYTLAVEVRDRQGELVARREQFLQRNNPMPVAYDMRSLDQMDLANTFADAISNKDTLAEFIQSMKPIADPLERKMIEDRARDRDMDHMKRFFYTFWASRSPDPEKAWLDYHEQVVKVNKLFSCRIMKGYETDRGYVFLKYGAPNTMMDRFNEMGTLPYSIWHYYRAGRYSNKRFVFYQPDLANTCLQLLHSEVPGEIQNPQWNQILHQRNVPLRGVQTVDPHTIESDRVREFFNDPR
jgi:GWxTD domain-containing protein